MSHYNYNLIKIAQKHFEDDDNKAVNTTSSKNVDKVVEQSDTGDDESKS